MFMATWTEGGRFLEHPQRGVQQNTRVKPSPAGCLLSCRIPGCPKAAPVKTLGLLFGRLGCGVPGLNSRGNLIPGS